MARSSLSSVTLYPMLGLCLMLCLIGMASSANSDLIISSVTSNDAVTSDLDDNIPSKDEQLDPFYYTFRCPLALPIIHIEVAAAVLKEPRMGASLLRLHFHDCFVQGCDASVLLKDTTIFKGEQSAPPNVNSLRGFEVIDRIKAKLERVCPRKVSCADILTVAARDSVVALGGQGWIVDLGRKDSISANFIAAKSDLPAPFLDLNGLITAFKKKGFTANEMVALSGAHTIGKSRCLLFRSRIYNESNIDPSFAKKLKANCPEKGGDGNLSSLDVTTPDLFDSAYYRNLWNKKGLLHSDQQLFNNSSTDSKVKEYATNPLLFRQDFANAMVKMSKLSPLTGKQGRVRSVCSRVNSEVPNLLDED